MKKKYILGVFISVVLIFLNQILIQFALDTITGHAKQINIAGRQRMLSQKLNLNFYQLNQELIKIEDIEKDFNTWKTSHYSLLNGNKEMKLDRVQAKKAIANLKNLTGKILVIEKAINQYKKSGLININLINQNQSSFLVNMNENVDILEKYASEKINSLILMEILLALISIVVIGLEVRYIYYPQARFLAESKTKILEQNKILKEIAWEQSHETRKPVANILGLCDLLTKNNNLKEEDQKEALHHLKNSAKELDAVIKKTIDKTHVMKEK